MSTLASCGHAVPAPTATAASTATGTGTPSAADAAVSQEETLAAIQKAMNELAPAAQQCWAAAATERFDIAGSMKVRLTIGGPSVRLDRVADTTGSDVLWACMTKLLLGYPWPPPLYGQSIELPFAFKAPAGGQSIVDRRLVSWHGQGKVSVAVLLDAVNSGNPGASLLEVALAAGGSTGRRSADRAEIWYFLGPAKLTMIVGARGSNLDVRAERVAEGDMLFVPKDAAREIAALDTDVHAVVAIVPGGPEGAARAGALPTREASLAYSGSAPLLLRQSVARTYGPATIYLDDSVANGTPLAASVLELPAGAKVPAHVHGKENELLYVLTGRGVMTVAGTDVVVSPTSVIQIPQGTEHAFAATEPVRAVQIYTPAGPEQRFKNR
jgi:quercetin dioxygenase-like cupin family protein